MKISQDTWTGLMVMISVAILGLEYDVVSFKSTSINISIISIDEFKINTPHILVASVLAVLLISVFMQSKYALSELKNDYSKGYKNLQLAEYVTNYIAEICGHKAHGAPYGNLKPGIFKKPIKPGKFTTQAGRLSDDLSIDLPVSIHLKSVFSGMWSVFSSKNMFFGVLPISIGQVCGWCDYKGAVCDVTELEKTILAKRESKDGTTNEIPF